ncbi:maltodextrin phosphorylase, putative [Babesia ovata]|uniref:Maltodextrin phosphorylase, putative n=1 Tax=Babesia ovata TaxID=189622 RepID=A0A2H6K7A8_9APIC|nr:maltodextrin phosphorylase, putative [Babesia ovata]GBE58872.1 maltodextrin phosphorylase, putative [Babesia ovata]
MSPSLCGEVFLGIGVLAITASAESLPPALPESTLRDVGGPCPASGDEACFTLGMAMFRLSAAERPPRFRGGTVTGLLLFVTVGLLMYPSSAVVEGEDVRAGTSAPLAAAFFAGSADGCARDCFERGEPGALALSCEDALSPAVPSSTALEVIGPLLGDGGLTEDASVELDEAGTSSIPHLE